MVLTSGDPPYDYVVKGPLRGTNPYIDSFVHGPSGILLEQGQFVITAEHRRFGTSEHELPTFNLYVNPIISPSGPYEPKANGSTLGNEIYPGSLGMINHILETREALDDLFDDLADDSTYDALTQKRDWLNQIDPTAEAPSDYRRSDTSVGQIVTTDVSILGGSGILFGLDFGEVMFNPYPRFGPNVFQDVHEVGDFDLWVSPVWPSFQRTNGSLISLNGREPDPDDYGNSFARDYQTSHIASDQIRLDGYVFLPTSVFYIAPLTGGGVHSFDNTIGFDFASSDTRFITGNPLKELDTGRVFVTTRAQTSGVYAIAVSNPTSTNLNTTIPSGIISQWPPSGQRYPMDNNHIITADSPFNVRGSYFGNQEFACGYQVFDDCLWVTDIDDDGTQPSGLSVISPFTGHMLWLRFADQSLSSGSGVFGGSVGSAASFGGHVGLENVSSVIYRSQVELADGSTASARTVLIQQYDQMLDYLGQIETDENPTVGPNPSVIDLTHIPSTTNWWVGIRITVGVVVYRFDSSWSFIDSPGVTVIGNPATLSATNNGRFAELDSVIRAANVHNSPGASSFDHRGSGIWDCNTSDIASGSGIVVENCRLVDFAPVLDNWEGQLANCTIFDMQEVAGATHLVDGNYILCSVGAAGPPFTRRALLVRAEPRDDASAPGFCVGFWDILGVYDFGTVPGSAESLDFQMIFKDVD